MLFYDDVIYRMQTKGSLICAGIDPDPNMMPSFYKQDTDGLYEFVYDLLSTLSPYTLSFKFQMAHFLAWGDEGIKILKRSIEEFKNQSIFIIDGKFNDIPNTQEFYKKFAYDYLKIDAITLNPLMGIDSIMPFVSENKGIFVLVHTSNNGSRDFQELDIKGTPFYFHVISKVKDLKNKNIGYVVGATFPEILKNIRNEAKGDMILVPGIGTQGGKIEDVLKNTIIEKTDITMLVMSRSLIYNKEENKEGYFKKIIDTANNINMQYQRHIKNLTSFK
ncbi:MAG: orotidine-5'-phosphate decarboxylase [Thermoplasmata archaeon]